MPEAEVTPPGPAVSHPATFDAHSVATLVKAAEVITALTGEEDLAPPGTIIVSRGNLTIMPETVIDTPIATLLSWADRLDGDPEWHAAMITSTPVKSAYVTASGTIDGLTVRITASTIRVSDRFAELLSRHTEQPVPRSEVIALAATEDVLGR